MRQLPALLLLVGPALMLRCCLPLLLFTVPVVGGGQNPSTHPQVVRNADGQIEISVTGSRPLAEAVTAIRRKFGLVIDYEESQPNASELYTDPDGRPELLNYQDVLVVLSSLRTPTTMGAIQAQLTRMAKQFSSATRSVRVATPSKLRFSISTAATGKWLLLDTLITLPTATRTIDATVTAICEAAAEAHGTSCVLGGIVDGELLNTTIQLGSDQPTQARELLATALDQAPDRKVWMLCFEPSENRFVLGIQPAVYAMESGMIEDLPRIR